MWSNKKSKPHAIAALLIASGSDRSQPKRSLDLPIVARARSALAQAIPCASVESITNVRAASSGTSLETRCP